ncbi:MAG: M15 family metallopeptidase [Rikenellaceae bacterium]|nr:M15 family metallopeptidase [Rikenellaceae bacterium]
MPAFSSRSLENLRGVHSELVRLMHLSIRDTHVDFTITEGVRTTSRQQSLYARGRTAPGPIITSCDGIRKKSNHQPHGDGYGYAVDLYPFIDGKVQVEDAANLCRIAAHIKRTAQEQGIDVEWGGDWKMRDYPHFELKTSRSGNPIGTMNGFER